MKKLLPITILLLTFVILLIGYSGITGNENITPLMIILLSNLQLVLLVIYLKTRN